MDRSSSQRTCREFLIAPLMLMAGFLLYAHWPERKLPAGFAVDRLLVEKGKRRLTLFNGDKIIRRYRVALGKSPVRPKEREGDNKTPEGTYQISGRNENSKFHRSLRISYPGPRDLVRAEEAGLSPGGDIMIHGLRNGFGWLGRFHRMRDWTAGCIAVTDREIEEIWQVVPDGTVIEIRP